MSPNFKKFPFARPKSENGNLNTIKEGLCSDIMTVRCEQAILDETDLLLMLLSLLQNVGARGLLSPWIQQAALFRRYQVSEL